MVTIAKMPVRLWRWCRQRPVFVVAGLIALMLVLRLWWGWWVGRQVEGKLAELRRQGHPVTLAEVPNAPVPDEENAWAWQVRAAKGANDDGIDSPRTSTMEYPGYPPYSAQWVKLAEASEKAHQENFRLARRARDFSKVQTRKRLEAWGVIEFSHVNDVKWLTNLLADGAEYMQAQGNTEEALYRLLDVLHVARSMRRDPFVIPQLVAIGIDVVACNAAQIIGPGLTRENLGKDAPARKAAVELINVLLDEDDRTARAGLAMDTERMFWVHTCKLIAEDTWVIRPLAQRDLIRALPNFDILYNAAVLPSWPQARVVLQGSHWEEVEGKVDDQFTVMLRNMFGGKSAPPPRIVPRYSRWFYVGKDDVKGFIERDFRCVAERRVTALALACQLYRVDHGKWPERLDELPPAYLDAIPLDPFRADEARIGYVLLHQAGGAQRPMLYYDAGADAPPPKEPTYGWYSGRQNGLTTDYDVRQYRDLSLFVPPSAKTVNYKPN